MKQSSNLAGARKKKKVRVGVTACTALAAGVATAITPVPAQAQEHAWEVRISASNHILSRDGRHPARRS